MCGLSSVWRLVVFEGGGGGLEAGEGEILPRTFMVRWRAGLNGAKGEGDANDGEEFGGEASCRFLRVARSMRLGGCRHSNRTREFFELAGGKHEHIRALPSSEEFFENLLPAWIISRSIVGFSKKRKSSWF